MSSMQTPIQICKPSDMHYPSLLQTSLGNPPLLYYKGDIRILGKDKTIIAIIGSRNVSSKGKQLSFAAGEAAAENGFVVVNGLALGCDCEALKGALQANGKCAVVLPCGLDQIVPRCNESLANEILENGGCLLSEYPAGTRPSRYSYVERDRIQSGVSNGILVIETSEQGGTMHTVNHARRQQKRLACYFGEIIGYSSGNQLLGNKKGITVIQNEEDLDTFLHSLKETCSYEQLNLF